MFFLPAVFCIYWTLRRHLTWQNLFVVAASYVFYGAWSYKFLLLIAFTTVCSYASGLMMQRVRDRKTLSRTLCVSNIVINLGILVVYKYFNFFSQGLQTLAASIGWHIDTLTLELILPVGISFYTFQALSYTIDVYRGKLTATKDMVAFFAYLSFFPQLVAGPIERAGNLLPQFLKNRNFYYALAVKGMRQILWGLFKKVAIADACGSFVDVCFLNYDLYPGWVAACGAMVFAFQIYCDFSGYSDIAIGTARLFGIRLSKNFDYPFFSRNMAEMWRRWHITLNTWFIDYVYIPLGGNRRGLMITLRNLLIVFLLSGLWHGADMTFVIWGALNGLCVMLLVVLGKSGKYKGTIAAQDTILPSLRETLSIITTFLIFAFTFIFFRAENLPQATAYISHMFSCAPAIDYPIFSHKLLLAIALLVGAEWINRRRDFGLDIAGNGLLRRRAARWTLYYIIIMFTILCITPSQDFIYFQF